jgi:putative sterol carrier protein
MHTMLKRERTSAEQPLTVEESFRRLERTFRARGVTRMNIVVQYDIEGDGGGTWKAIIERETCSISKGPAVCPHLTLRISTQDWLDIVQHKHSPFELFMSGRMIVRGDIALAVRFPSLFAST